MTTTPFNATVRHQPGLAIIDLYGDLTALADDALKLAFTQAESHSSPILLNFGGVDYINSFGIGLIIDLVTRSIGSRRALQMCSLRPNCRKVFGLMGLSAFVDIFSDEAGALILGSASAEYL